MQVNVTLKSARGASQDKELGSCLLRTALKEHQATDTDDQQGLVSEVDSDARATSAYVFVHELPKIVSDAGEVISGQNQVQGPYRPIQQKTQEGVVIK